MNKQEKVQCLVEAVIGKDYGVTLQHWEIASIIEEKECSQRYRTIVASASKRLLDSGKMIENVKGVGYRIVRPDEYALQSAKCVISGGRKINKGAKVLQNAPVKDMSESGIQSYNAISDRMRILQAAVAGARCEINMLASKREHPYKAAITEHSHTA